MAEPYLGEIKTFGFNFAPRGWALCDGQVLPISQNQSLYSLLGTTYGGDGRTTFALPDLRGRAPMHYSLNSGVALGQKSGQETVTLAKNEMPTHTHTASISNTATTKVYAEAATSDDPSGMYFGKPSTNVYIESGRTSASMAEDAISVETSVQIENTGGFNPHDNMQPYIAVIYCIATVGLFPSRN